MASAHVSARTIARFERAALYGEHMSRPRLYDEPRACLAVRLPVSLRSELQRAAEARDVSANHLATKAIRELLARLGAEQAGGAEQTSDRVAS